MVTQLVHSNSFFIPNEDAIAFEYTGWLTVPASGSYTFGVRSDDGSDVYLWINNEWVLVAHAYGYKPVESTYTYPMYIGIRTLTTGVNYPIRVRYHENMGLQALHVEWKTPSAPSTWVAIPFGNFHCNGTTPITTDTLREDYPEPRVEPSISDPIAAILLKGSSLSGLANGTQITSWTNNGTVTGDASGILTTKPIKNISSGQPYAQLSNSSTSSFQLLQSISITTSGVTFFLVMTLGTAVAWERIFQLNGASGNNENATISLIRVGDIPTQTVRLQVQNGTTWVSVVNVPSYLSAAGTRQVYAMKLYNAPNTTVKYFRNNTAITTTTGDFAFTSRTTAYNWIGSLGNFQHVSNMQLYHFEMRSGSLADIDIISRMNQLKTQYDVA